MQKAHVGLVGLIVFLQHDGGSTHTSLHLRGNSTSSSIDQRVAISTSDNEHIEAFLASKVSTNRIVTVVPYLRWGFLVGLAMVFYVYFYRSRSMESAMLVSAGFPAYAATGSKVPCDSAADQGSLLTALEGVPDSIPISDGVEDSQIGTRTQALIGVAEKPIETNIPEALDSCTEVCGFSHAEKFKTIPAAPIHKKPRLGWAGFRWFGQKADDTDMRGQVVWSNGTDIPKDAFKGMDKKPASLPPRRNVRASPPPLFAVVSPRTEPAAPEATLAETSFQFAPSVGTWHFHMPFEP